MVSYLKIGLFIVFFDLFYPIFKNFSFEQAIKFHRAMYGIYGFIVFIHFLRNELPKYLS